MYEVTGCSENAYDKFVLTSAGLTSFFISLET